jgi:hypothetical protein
MAERQTHTGWWIACYLFLAGWSSFLAIDYWNSQRPARASLLLLCALGWAFQLVRHIIGALRKKEASKQNSPIDASS